MTGVASVIYVMIASPSDVAEAREAVYTAVGRWNESNSRDRGIVLVPLRWETGTVPSLGNHPQAIINRQLVEKSDVVIALFGSRLGSATPNAISGTVEEVNGAVDNGKPVHLYFSTAPHPNDVDIEQLRALHEFRSQLEQNGLFGTFSNPTELIAHVWQAIEQDIVQFRAEGVLGPVVAPSPDVTPPTTADVHAGESADMLLQGGLERSQEADAKGRLRTRVHRWVDVINRGTGDARDVVVEPTDDGVFLGSSERSRTVHAGQTQRIPYDLSLAASGERQFTMRWTDDSGPHEKTFDV